MRFFYKIQIFLSQLRTSIDRRIENFGAQYIAFGIFGVLNYPLFYIIWKYYNATSYENLTLRLTATFLCALLLLKNYWPPKIKPWFSLYWYFTLLFCLPFFFFFMLFKNDGSNSWLMSSNTILFWLLLMVDWVSYFVIFSLGVSLAILFYFLTTKNAGIYFYGWWGIIFQFIASFIVVLFFATEKQRFDKQKLQTMKTLAMDIAHELRTPLAAIYAGAEGTKDYLPHLIEAYNLAKQENLPVKNIRSSQVNLLYSVMDSIVAETRYSNIFINMLLVNVEQMNISSDEFQKCSMVKCIEEALNRYPFQPGERELIDWSSKTDFIFMGKEILTVHILFNLLKNAIYYVRASGKGNIKIWIVVDDSHNKLYFRDTGKGISENILPNIFDLFFTKTYHGSGIGLAFCKTVMQSYGGKIECKSVEGQFTEFILSFPNFS